MCVSVWNENCKANKQTVRAVLINEKMQGGGQVSRTFPVAGPRFRGGANQSRARRNGAPNEAGSPRL